MTAKKIIFDNDVRNELQMGVATVAKAVGVTIGPRGRNVALDKSFGGPRITNDGVSIAKEIELKDKFQNMGAEIIKEVASKTNDVAGDGTTTAMVLTNAIVEEGFKRTAMGANATVVRKGIEAAAKDAVAELKKMSKKVKDHDDVVAVASISAESEELGKTIADTIDKVGKDGVVTVEESQSVGISSDVVEGLEFDKGYVSPYMITNAEKMEAELKDVPVLVTDQKISTVKDVLPLLEQLAQNGKKDVVIIADDIEGEALTTFVINKLRGTLNVLGIKAPGYGDNKKAMLNDIATVLGATVIASDLSMKLEDATIDMLGEAGRVVAGKDKTVIVDGKGSKNSIEELVDKLRAQAQNTESKFDKEKLEERIAKLSGGVAVIRVGAATETEMKYLKDKIDDAVNATKSAIDEGIVPGGGTALVKVADKLSKNKVSGEKDEFGVGYRIMINALRAPFKQIVMNAGRDDAEVIISEMIKKGDAYGFDASSDAQEPRIVDMFKEGIIDPTKVERAGVEHSASAAAVLLTTDAAIAEDKDESDDATAPAMPGMGGGMPMM
jgi:chaperonin GroEL